MADAFWFFVSYARLELDVHIKRFREDVATLLRSLGGIEEPKNERVGFLDIDGIEHGKDWPAELGSALHVSRVLVPLYSPLYFKREYCGKEFQVFRHPQQAYVSGTVLPASRPILPVLLYPLAEPDWPASPDIRELQTHDDRYPQAYIENGLHFLMDTPGYDAEYKKFCWAFAKRLIEAANSAPSFAAVPATQLKKLHVIPAAFPNHWQAQYPPHSMEDLRMVRFICGAAKRGEIQRKVDAYGSLGGVDWKPFAPADLEVIGIIAQEAALRERFLSDSQPLDQNLSAHLEDTATRHGILIVLVDPWSLTLQSYRRLIAPCDEMKPYCAVIVSWNSNDTETVDQSGALRIALGQALPKIAVAIRHPVFFRDTPDTRARLQSEIQSTLADIYMRMLQAKAARLGLTADPPPSISNAQEEGPPNA